MSWLRERRRLKDVVMSCQRVSCQGTGTASSSDCLDCAPGGGNYLHSPRSSKARDLGHPSWQTLDLRSHEVRERPDIRSEIWSTRRPAGLLEDQIDLLHQQEEPVWLSCERGKLVLHVKIASALFGIHDHCPAGDKFRGLPGFVERVHKQHFADAFSSQR